MKQLLSAFMLLSVLFGCDRSKMESSHKHSDTTHTGHAIDSANNDSMQQLMTEMMNAMHAQKSTGNNDVDFAQMMMAHHQGAVKMAELQISKGSNEVLKEFSRNVIATQTAEIDSFQRVLAVTSPVMSSSTSEFQKALEATMQPMMTEHTHHSKDIDTDFAELMIPHHQSAVDMAKAYQKFGTNIGLKNISQSIIQTQSKEIDWLNEWLKNKK